MGRYVTRVCKDKRTWRERHSYRRQWGRRLRGKLLAELGQRCAFCGTRQRLHLDCIEPRRNHYHRGDAVSRMVFYRREHARGNIQLLCLHCNAVKGSRRNYRPPFVPIPGRDCAR